MPDPLAAALRVAETANDGSPANALLVTKVRALLRAYDKVWTDDRDHDILAVEQLAVAPLWNVETKKISRTFATAGKLDLCILDGAKRYIVIDHKTTGDEIEEPDSLYYKTQIVEGQWLHYHMLERLNGRRIDHVLLNVLRKPSISPRQLNSSQLAVVLNEGTYYGERISPEARIHAQQTQRENLELYGLRLYYDATVERPRFYFARRPLFRTDKTDLYEYMADLWQDAIAIRDERLVERHTKNSRACMAYGTPCQFLGICSGYDQEDSDRWERVKNVHEELPMLGRDSRSYLTNSRVGMFKLCRRKHNFLYNIGIRRQEPSEARDFGILWHNCLAAYYLEIQANQEQERKQDSESTAKQEDRHADASAESRV
jgi:PD-(D/E)XK nuclease superfamily